MFNLVLDRLEHDHGHELVENALSLIGICKHGILENELLDLLATDNERHLPSCLLG